MATSPTYLYGSVLKSDSIGKFVLSETAYSQNLQLPTHFHDLTYFCFVLEGNFTEFYEKQLRLCQPLTLIFHPAGEKHSNKFHTNARCFNIQMKPRWIEQVRDYSQIINTPTDFNETRLSFLTTRIYQEFCQIDEFSPLVIEGLMLEILAETSRFSRQKLQFKPPHWLQKAVKILDECFRENISTSSVADLVRVHPVHLSREFHRFYHCTIGEYKRQKRIKFACRQILTTNFSLSEIAVTAGFFDQSHFTNSFKKVIGISPREYRLALRQIKSKC